MEIFEAIIQGAIQGVTEFLPVSSSGHLVLSQHIMGLSEGNLFFDVMLHIGTLIAVFAVYHKQVIKLIKAFFSIIVKIFTAKFRWRKLNKDESMVMMIIIGLTPLILLFLPVSEGVKDIKGIAEDLSSANSVLIPGICLLATGLLLHLGLQAEKKSAKAALKAGSRPNNEGRKRINMYDALWIGLAQLLAAIFPGLSRSGSTLSIGLMRGINKQDALDYSFILGMPAILAAAALELKTSLQTGAAESIGLLPVVIGVLVSATVGFGAIKLFKWLLATDRMYIFVLYTAILGAITVIIGIIENVQGVNIFTGVSL